MNLRRHRGATPAPVGILAEPLAGPDTVPSPRLSDDAPLTTPFEDWCEANGTHPEALGAWELFTQQERVS